MGDLLESFLKCIRVRIKHAKRLVLISRASPTILVSLAPTHIPLLRWPRCTSSLGVCSFSNSPLDAYSLPLGFENFIVCRLAMVHRHHLFVTRRCLVKFVSHNSIPFQLDDSHTSAFDLEIVHMSCLHWKKENDLITNAQDLGLDFSYDALIVIDILKIILS